MKKLLWLFLLLPILVFARHNGPYPLNPFNGPYPFFNGSNAPVIHALPIDWMFNPTNGTVGSLITTANLAADTMSDISAGSWQILVANAPSLAQSTRLSNTNLGYSIPFLLNGSVIYGSSNFCLNITNILPYASSNETLQWQPSGSFVISNTPLLITARIRFESTGAQQDVILGDWYNGWIDMQGNSLGTPSFGTHGQTNNISTYSGLIPIIAAGNYFLLCRADINYGANGESELAILDSNGVLVGACQVPSNVSGLFVLLNIQNYLGYTGGHIDVGTVTIGISNNAAVPSWMFAQPQPTYVYASNAGSNTISIAWQQTGTRSELDRSTNGGANWSVISTNVEAPLGGYSTPTAINYFDTNVLFGSNYVYSVNARSLEIKSPFTNSASVTVTGTGVNITNGEIIAAWFDNSFNDQSANQYTGGVVGSPSFVTGAPLPNLPNGAASFDGSTAFITYGNISVPTSAFSCGGWIYPTAYSANSTIVSKWYDNVSTAQFQLEVNASGNIVFHTYLGGTFTGVTSANTVPLNTWSFVYGVYDGTDYNVYVYPWNGTSFVGQETSAIGLAGTATAEDLVIGAADNGSGGENQFFQGYLDDIRVFNLALTPSQVTNNITSSLLINSSK